MTDTDESAPAEGVEAIAPDLPGEQPADSAEVPTEVADEALPLTPDVVLTANELLGGGENEWTGGEGSEDDDDDAVVPVESPYDRPGQWFVVHSYAGYENKVKQNLESRIASMNMEEKIFEVVIPMEDVIEFKNGKKQVVSKKVFPGYLMVRMDLDDDSWYVVRNTPGVTGFVGLGARPTPLSRKEVENILQVKAEDGDGSTTKKSRPRL